MYFQNMDVVKIKCGNSFSENEVKGHQPVLTVFYMVKTKKAKLQSFLDFPLKFQFLLLNNDIFVRKLKSIYRTSTDFYVLWRLKKTQEKLQHFFCFWIILSTLSVILLLKYYWNTKGFVSNKQKKNQNLFTYNMSYLT